jgi:hypothetical protein
MNREIRAVNLHGSESGTLQTFARKKKAIARVARSLFRLS